MRILSGKPRRDARRDSWPVICSSGARWMTLLMRMAEVAGALTAPRRETHVGGRLLTAG